MVEKKRLKKDLPFGELKAGMVLTKTDDGYEICFKGFSYPLPDNETSIIDKIWNDEEWFEPAIVDVLVIKYSYDKIEIVYPTMDGEDAHLLASKIAEYLSSQYTVVIK